MILNSMAVCCECHQKPLIGATSCERHSRHVNSSKTRSDRSLMHIRCRYDTEHAKYLDVLGTTCKTMEQLQSRQQTLPLLAALVNMGLSVKRGHNNLVSVVGILPFLLNHNINRKLFIFYHWLTHILIWPSLFTLFTYQFHHNLEIKDYLMCDHCRWQFEKPWQLQDSQQDKK